VISSEICKAEDSIEYHELPSEEGQAKAASDNERLSDEGNMNLLQALCSVNFWLLFIAMFCGLGSGLAMINNISQIGESLGYTATERNSLVSLLSIWNFLGRFGAGFVSDIFLHRGGWARPLFVAVTLAIMTIGHIIVAAGFSKNLYLGSVLVGVAYGSQWSLMPTITSEIFGVAHMGTIFNTIAIASPVGSYTFSVRVIGFIYDKVGSGENNTCFGSRCFMLSFMIMASVAFFGVLVALLLFFRTRRFYKSVVFRRLQNL
jgi:MFS family permease